MLNKYINLIVKGLKILFKSILQPVIYLLLTILILYSHPDLVLEQRVYIDDILEQEAVLIPTTRA